MKMRTVLWAVSAAVALLISMSAEASILVAPSSPTSTQSVHIQLVNQYASQASITSATINRIGNQFVINQVIDLACTLPVAPILTSDFDVGVLPAGTYQVTAQIQHTSALPGCGGFILTQSASFVVGDPLAVPTLGPWGYFVLALLLIYGAMRANRRNEA